MIIKRLQPLRSEFICMLLSAHFYHIFFKYEKALPNVTLVRTCEQKCSSNKQKYTFMSKLILLLFLTVLDCTVLNVPIYDCIFGFGITSLNNNKRFSRGKPVKKIYHVQLFNQNFGNRTLECVRLAIFFVWARFCSIIFGNRGFYWIRLISITECSIR